jgi:hypothetical protein
MHNLSYYNHIVEMVARTDMKIRRTLFHMKVLGINRVNTENLDHALRVKKGYVRIKNYMDRASQ